MRLKQTEACGSILERCDTKQRALTPVLVLEVQSLKVISAGQGWSQAVGGGGRTWASALGTPLGLGKSVGS